MAERPLFLFYNDFWTTLGPIMRRSAWPAQVLRVLAREPVQLPAVLAWPCHAARFRLGWSDRTRYLVASLAAALSDSERIRVSTDAGRLQEADAVMFHAPTLDAEAFAALPKRGGQVWISVNHESRNRTPWQSAPHLRERIDILMDHGRDADVWAPYFNDYDLKRLRTPPPPKRDDAIAAMFVSSAVNDSGRLEYLRELMQRIEVHSYGRQLNNRRLENDSGIVSKRAAIARYRFTLSFENRRETDYVTEKFFEPLWTGSVPVYLGAPNIRDFAPGENCYIDAADFPDPADLAAHLRTLAEDGDRYEALLAWKRQPYRKAFLDFVEPVRTPVYRRLLDRIECIREESTGSR